MADSFPSFRPKDNPREDTSSGVRALIQVLSESYTHTDPRFETLRERFTPLAEWLARPKTIEEFNTLKADILSLCLKNNEIGLANELRVFQEEPHEYYPEIYPTDMERFAFEKEYWTEAMDYLFRLSARLKIFPQQHFDQIRRDTNKDDLSSFRWREWWDKFEGDSPTICEFPCRAENLDMLTWNMNMRRGSGIVIGLTIGNFRAGDHKGHGEFIRHAKKALGNDGILVVIIPSRETIMNVTSKKNVWSDDDRAYRLMVNRYVDYVLVADMPQEHYPNPDTYWRMVWGDVQPDFIFLGEENHPLQPTYEKQCRELGGILLIDDSPVIQRSENLLDVT